MKVALVVFPLILSACASRAEDAYHAADHAAYIGEEARETCMEASQQEFARHRADPMAMDASPRRSSDELLGP